jgi:hypothetical protein
MPNFRIPPLMLNDCDDVKFKIDLHPQL